ncbi:MAG: DNA sulfur modification protein DndD, partial [Acidobacteria bacterium]|nr:DNA sulfur modification protein DndD [Acidobacteriota bacterium]
AAISEAIQTLLGLDLVKALQSDLAIYRSRLLKSANPTAYDQEVAAIEAELTRLNAEKEKLVTDERHHQTVLDGIKNEIAQLQKRLAQKGGNYASQKAANDLRAHELESRHNALVTSIREECESPLPFALCPKLSRRLATELDAESLLRNYRVLDDELSRLQESVLASAGTKLANGTKKELGAFLETEFSRYREGRRPASDITELHSLSERDAALTIDCLTQQAPASARRLHTTLIELEEVTRELRVVKGDSEQAPEQLVLQDTFTELNQRNRDLGRTEEVKRKISEELRQVELAISAKEREREKILSRLDEAKDVAHKTATIQKLNTALSAYMHRLTQAKIAQLQSEVTECYNRLARKSDFVRRVDIDPETFAVAVIDKFGRSVPKEDLSSGEKQIFAISMLWGLARTSGRPLPVVIDTPLGRLDSDHRKNLIRNYFPHAGHQVLLLSTDTEVDVDLFKELSPAVSHCYHLKYDQEEARTTADNEYFWRETVTA